MSIKKITQATESFRGIDERVTFAKGPNTAVSMKNITVTPDLSLKVRDAIVRKMNNLGEKIIRIWCGKARGIDSVLVVTENYFYRYNSSFNNVSQLFANPSSSVCLIPFNKNVYILTGAGYFVFNGLTMGVATGYIPLVAISCPPAGGGVLYEKANMLTGTKRQRFSPDGKATAFYLLEKNLLDIKWVKHNGTTLALYTDYYADTESGSISVKEPLPSGENTLEVCYTSRINNRAVIDGCTGGCVFGSGNDTRLFLYGNSSSRDTRYHSELANGVPSAVYFPETNFTQIPGQVITSIIRHYDRQLIFTSASAFYSTDELLSDGSGMYYHSFPVYSLNSEKGHVLANTGACLIDNMPVSACEDGLYGWKATAIRDERNAQKLSDKVDSIYKELMSVREDYPLFMHDVPERRELWLYNEQGKALIYNYGLDVWYYYCDLGCSALGDIDGKLIFGDAAGGLFEFSESAVKDRGIDTIAFSYVSPYFNFGEPDKLKSLEAVKVVLDSKKANSFLLSLTGDSDSKTTGNLTFSTAADGSGKAGIVSQSRRVFLKRCTSVRIEFKSTGDGGMKLLAFGIEAVMPKKERCE